MWPESGLEIAIRRHIVLQTRMWGKASFCRHACGAGLRSADTHVGQGFSPAKTHVEQGCVLRNRCGCEASFCRHACGAGLQPCKNTCGAGLRSEKQMWVRGFVLQHACGAGLQPCNGAQIDRRRLHRHHQLRTQSSVSDESAADLMVVPGPTCPALSSRLPPRAPSSRQRWPRPPPRGRGARGGPGRLT
jgi:hypothetical protein